MCRVDAWMVGRLASLSIAHGKATELVLGAWVGGRGNAEGWMLAGGTTTTEISVSEARYSHKQSFLGAGEAY